MAARAMEKLHVSGVNLTLARPLTVCCLLRSSSRLLSFRRSRRVSTSRTPGWSCATPTVARPGCSPPHWRRASLPHSRRGWLPGKHRPLPRWPVHLSPIYLTFPPLCPVRGDAARSTETSVTSGEQPAAISGTSAATNTFQTRRARTGNPGSPELHHQHHHIDRDSSDAFACWKSSVSPELTLTLRSNNQSEQNDQHLIIQVSMQWESGMSLSNSHIFDLCEKQNETKGYQKLKLNSTDTEVLPQLREAIMNETSHSLQFKQQTLLQ